jgi:hypothetical protein
MLPDIPIYRFDANRVNAGCNSKVRPGNLGRHLIIPIFYIHLYFIDCDGYWISWAGLIDMPIMEQRKKNLVGIAGSYFVAAELSQKGFVATVTSRNTEGIDVLASRLDGSKSVSIQVRTSSGEQRKEYSRWWRMETRHENIHSDNFFYVFVDLENGPEKPNYYIVPSKYVANYIKSDHEEWLNTSSRSGKKNKYRSSSFFEIEDKQVPEFLNRWDRLGL